MVELTITVVIIKVFAVIPSILSVVFIVLLIKEIFGIGYNGSDEKVKDAVKKTGNKLKDWWKGRQAKKEEEWEKKEKEIEESNKELKDVGNFIGNFNIISEQTKQKVLERIRKLSETINHERFKEILNASKGVNAKPHPKYRVIMEAIQKNLINPNVEDINKLNTDLTESIKSSNEILTKLDKEKNKISKEIESNINEETKNKLLQEQKEIYEALNNDIRSFKELELGLKNSINIIFEHNRIIRKALFELLSNNAMNKPVEKGQYETHLVQSANHMIKGAELLEKHHKTFNENKDKLKKHESNNINFQF